MNRVERRAAARAIKGRNRPEVVGIVLSHSEPNAILYAQRVLDQPMFRNHEMRGLLSAWLHQGVPAMVVAAGATTLRDGGAVGGFAEDADGVCMLVTLAYTRLNEIGATRRPFTSMWTFSVPEAERGELSALLATLQPTGGSA